MLNCIICNSEPEIYRAVQRLKVANRFVPICEECLPDLFAECSRITINKAISGSYAADTIFTVQKRLESRDEKINKIKGKMIK